MIERIFIIALVTLGYCCVFWQDMIFEGIGNWMEAHAPQWLWKPLGGCYICACMWIGSIVYWVLYKKHFYGGGITVDVKDWLLTCIGAMGVNAVVSFVSRIGEKEQGPGAISMTMHERHEYHPDGTVVVTKINTEQDGKSE